MYSGFLEIFHDDEWGLVSLNKRFFSSEIARPLTADVACRQLGFPHGTLVPGGNSRGSVTPFGANSTSRPSDILWLSDIRCNGPEAKLVDCDLQRGFNRRTTKELTPDFVVCRQFPVAAAQENVTTAGAGAVLAPTCMLALCRQALKCYLCIFGMRVSQQAAANSLSEHDCQNL